MTTLGDRQPAIFDYFRFRFFASQSSPSYKPSPVVAQVACMFQVRLPRPLRPSFSVISTRDIAFGKSCLFANTRRIASRSSSSRSIFSSSLRASPTRSRSLLSTTKIIPRNLVIIRKGHRNSRHTLRVLEIMAPQWPDLILSSDVPNSEANIFVFHCLDIEPFVCIRFQRIRLSALTNQLSESSSRFHRV